MKIEFEKPKQAVHFVYLEIGTVFCDPSYDTVYMKTEYINNDGDEINSIDLATGEFNYFSDYTEVCPLDAILYIKE